MNTKSQKIFLTGERDVGKTTIIERFAKKLDFVPFGFNTVPGKMSADGSSDHIFIIPFGTSLEDFPDTPPAATRDKIKMGFQSYPEVFDSLGAEILKNSRGAKLIIMDELGFMEAEALAFQREVLASLDENAPVLGVIKPLSTPFLDSIREHAAVQTIEVTVENRNRIFESLIKNFKIA